MTSRPPQRRARPPIKRSWKLELPAALTGGALSVQADDLPAGDYATRNPWTCATLVTSALPDYADRLCAPSGPYHVPLAGARPVAEDVADRIRGLWTGGDDVELLEAFFDCPRFPVQHPTIAMARHGMLESCTWLTGEIAAAIRDLGLDEALRRAGAPVEPSKRLGAAFSNYVAGRFDTVTDWDALLASTTPLTAMAGQDATLKQIAGQHLGYQGHRGVDLILRIATRRRQAFVVAEAKFISDGGGGQDGKVKEALGVTVSGSEHDVQAVAVIDGMPLTPFYTRRQYKEMIRDSKRPVLSALLLEDYANAALSDLRGGRR